MSRQPLLRFALSLLLLVFGVSAALAGNTGPVHVPVSTIGATTGSGYFSFWLEEPTKTTGCGDGNKFSIKIDATNAKEIIDIVKMAFLSGHPVRVWWNGCTHANSAGLPTYVKIYRK